jgi:hypothetical protein
MFHDKFILSGGRYFRYVLLWISILLYLPSSSQRIVPEFGFLLGGNANTARRCDLDPFGNYSFSGGIKINSSDRLGMDHRCMISVTNNKVRYGLQEISLPKSKSFMVDHRFSLDLSLSSSFRVGAKSSLGMGIMVSGFIKSGFDAEYGVSVDRNMPIGMNISKADEDLQKHKADYMPSVLLSYRTPVFKLLGRQMGLLVVVRQNLMQLYRNQIGLEYGKNQQSYIKTVNPCITFLQTGFYF